MRRAKRKESYHFLFELNKIDIQTNILKHLLNFLRAHTNTFDAGSSQRKEQELH